MDLFVLLTSDPQITHEAKEFVVDQYKRLRQRDAGSSKSSWRITVRQLESMLRLSEAMARLYCSDEVPASHPRCHHHSCSDRSKLVYTFTFSHLASFIQSDLQ